MNFLKKFFSTIILFLLFPFIIIYLIYFVIYTIIEIIIVKNKPYFKKNNLKVKDNYYFFMLKDPIFHIRNYISINDLDIQIIERRVVNKKTLSYYILEDNNIKYCYMNMNCLFIDNDILYFQNYRTSKYKYDYIQKAYSSIRDDSLNNINMKIIVKKSRNKKINSYFMNNKDKFIILNNSKDIKKLFL